VSFFAKKERRVEKQRFEFDARVLFGFENLFFFCFEYCLLNALAGILCDLWLILLE
jgi:hypothetical protein